MHNKFDKDARLTNTNIVCINSWMEKKMITDNLEFDPELIVKVKLIKDVIYYKFGDKFVVPKGTEMQLDLDNMLATYENDYFKLFELEYEVLFQN